MASNLGVPGLPIVVIPHPLGGQAPEDVDRKAEMAVKEIVRVLTSPGAQLAEEFAQRQYQGPRWAEQARQVPAG